MLRDGSSGARQPAAKDSASRVKDGGCGGGGGADVVTTRHAREVGKCPLGRKPVSNTPALLFCMLPTATTTTPPLMTCCINTCVNESESLLLPTTT